MEKPNPQEQAQRKQHQKIDEQISYNWLFFLLAGAFAAVTGWAVYDETVTRREYKTYQETFFKVDVDLAKAKLASEQAVLDANPHTKELTDKLAALEAEVKAKRAEIEKLEAELQTVGFEAFDKTQGYTFSKSELDEVYYYYTKAKHDHLSAPNDAAAKSTYDSIKKRHDALAERTKRDEGVMFEADKKKKNVQARLDAAKRTAELKAVKKELETLRRPFDDAQRSLDAAEKKTGGLFGPGTEIVQQNLDDIEKVDRCESCHMGSNRSGFEAVAQEEFRSHPMRRTLLGIHPPEKFGCTTCHDGQGRATIKFFAHAPSAEEDPHAFHQHYWEASLLKGPKGGDGTEYMESKCLGCHRQEWDLRSELACEIDLECPSAPDGRPMICAAPRSVSTPSAPYGSHDQALAAAARAADKTTPVDEPKKLCLEVTDPKLKLVDATKPGASGTGFLDPAKKEDRDKILKKTQAALVELAPNLSKGLRVIEEVGCYGCHPIEGYLEKDKPGPNLTHAAAKFADDSAGKWMTAWIMDPKSFRPNTRMPRFWPEQLAPNDYPYPVDVAGQKKQQATEARAMASYLLATSKASTKYPYALEALPAGGDADRGKTLVASLGCAACHGLPMIPEANVDHKNRASHYDYGPDLSNVGAKTSEVWLYNWVRDPKRYAPDTRMPNLRLTPVEAADVAKYLSLQVGDQKSAKGYGADAPDPNDTALVAQGKDLIKYYGCFGCHQVEGFEGIPGIGAELSEFGVKTTDRLDFGDYITDHNQQTWDQWLYNKLKHPRVYSYERAQTRMPQFDLADEEIRQIMVVLKGMRGVTKESAVLGKVLSPEEAARQRGRELVRSNNCMGCHNIDGWKGDLRQLKQYSGENAKYGPPILEGQGAKTQPGWLFGFLKAPFKMRPLPQVRMPTFGFSDAEATDVAAMFSAFDRSQFPYMDTSASRQANPDELKIGRALFEFTGCQKCHVLGEVGATVPDGVVAPNLLIAKERLRPGWLAHWLADPNSIQPGTAMPGFWLSTGQLELAMKNDGIRAQLAGIDAATIAAYKESRELQIQAVRSYLMVLTGDATAAPTTATTREPARRPQGRGAR